MDLIRYGIKIRTEVLCTLFHSPTSLSDRSYTPHSSRHSNVPREAEHATQFTQHVANIYLFDLLEASRAPALYQEFS